MTSALLLPDIPRALTALAEWGACLTYLLLLRHRVPRLRLALVAAAGLVALHVIQEAAGHLPISLWTPGMLVAVATMYGILALAARTPARTTGYLLARAFVLAELVASLHWQLHVFLFADAHSAVVEGLFAAGIYSGAFALAHLLERRHFPDGEVPDIGRRGLAGAAAIAAVTFLMSNLSFVTTNTPFSASPGIEVFYIRTLVDLAGYAALLAQQSQHRELRRLRDVQAMEQLVRSQHQQYLQSRRAMDTVDRKYHDLKHYIAAFRAESDPQLRATHLDRLEESISDHGRQVRTGHSVLDTILTAKRAECDERGITLNTMVDGRALDGLDAVQLSALFGNALDNAVRAVDALEDPEERIIRVATRHRAGLVVVEFENRHGGGLTFDGDLPRTTRGSGGPGGEHGYGLRNMRQIAEEAGGSLTVSDEEGWFTVRALLPRSGAPEGPDAP